MMNRKPILADHFKHYIYPCAVAALGRSNAFFGSYSVDFEGNSYPYAAHMIADGEVKDLPEFLANADFSAWTDGDTCVFGESGDDDCTIYEYHPSTGARNALFTTEVFPWQAEQIGENRWLLLCSDDMRNDGLTAEQLEHREGCEYYEEFPFRYDGVGNCSRVRSRLYLWDNGEVRRLTADNLDIEGLLMTESYAVFYGEDFYGHREGDPRLYTLDRETLEIKMVPAPATFSYTMVVPAADDHVICARSDSAKYGDFQNEYMDLVNLKDGSFKRINDSTDLHLYDSVLTDMVYGASCMALQAYKTGVLFTCTDGMQAMVKYADFDTEEVETVAQADLNISEFTLCDDGRTMYLVARQGMNGQEIWSYDLETRAYTQITHYNDAVTKEYGYSEVEHYQYKSSNGEMIDGFMLKPLGFEEGKKYKTILALHGGPNITYGPCFYHQLQYFASCGYVVIYCNNHGSSGRGAKFADLSGKYYTCDVEDVISLYEYAVATFPFIDGDHVAVSGGSYGGMLVDWIITQHHMFRTAISDRGCANEMEDYFMSDCGEPFSIDQRGGNLWEPGVMEKIWKGSPIAYAPQVTTPTLFVHGELDYRCSKEQSLAMFAALRMNGVKSRVCIIKGENHGIWMTGSPQARAKRLLAMTDWFEETL